MDSLNFCYCGALVPFTTRTDALICGDCGSTFDASEFPAKNMKKTFFAPVKADPKWARPKNANEDDEAGSKNATIAETCPKCGHDTANFYTLQLRSVDEGSTVFYVCQKCKHKWSQNN